MFSKESSLKEVFAALNGLADGTQNGFWELISAIRGPDDSSQVSQDFKEKYVLPLRVTLLPDHPWSGGAGLSASEAQKKLAELQQAFGKNLGINGHFLSHLTSAYKTLVRMLAGDRLPTVTPADLKPVRHAPAVLTQASVPNNDKFWWR